eukprot:Opistho-2@26345
MLPSFWRLMQCIRRYVDAKEAGTPTRPHLLNSIKYLASMAVAGFSYGYLYTRDHYGTAAMSTEVLKYTWVCMAVVSTSYAWAWDLIMDWSFVYFDGLRPHLQMNLGFHPYVYYSAVVVNLLFRALWTLTVSPQVIGIYVDNNVLVCALAVAELSRRCVWNIFRLENEHRNNIGKFRVVKEVPLPYEVDGATNFSA